MSERQPFEPDDVQRLDPPGFEEADDGQPDRTAADDDRHVAFGDLAAADRVPANRQRLGTTGTAGGAGHLDTTAGVHTYAVTATSRDGQATSASIKVHGDRTDAATQRSHTHTPCVHTGEKRPNGYAPQKHRHDDQLPRHVRGEDAFPSAPLHRQTSWM
jgi:hypothetical protein